MLIRYFPSSARFAHPSPTRRIPAYCAGIFDFIARIHADEAAVGNDGHEWSSMQQANQTMIMVDKEPGINHICLLNRALLESTSNF
jgi:hypothetical protein